MRVLWFNHRDPKNPQAGGAEVRIHEIGKRLVQNGFSVKLVCERWSGSTSVEFLDGIKIVRVAGKYGIHLSVPFLLTGSDEYDIVVDDVAHAAPWFSPLFTNKAVVGQVHHVHQSVLDLELPQPLARFLALSERALPHVYRVLIAVSESTKRDLVNKLGVPEDRIKIIPNGVDLNTHRPMPKSSDPTVLVVGRMKRYKRIGDILSAFKLVEGKVPNVKLFIVGDGDHSHALKKMSQQLRLSSVVFTGKISDKEKTGLMASSWVVVSASLMEGWGMTITESAACATPAVSYDVAGLRDSIHDGLTGMLVENGNIKALAQAIIEVLENEQLRQRLSKNAMEYAQEFNWDSTAKEFMNVLERTENER
jgi:glycosyltransferase involved in cell wall biosynthesis